MPISHWGYELLCKHQLRYGLFATSPRSLRSLWALRCYPAARELENIYQLYENSATSLAGDVALGIKINFTPEQNEIFEYAM